jgi:uncharacterized membrane protein YuzA (DUF378 family)
MRNKIIHPILTLLLLAGGINWGLVGLFQVNLVAELFKDSAFMERAVYVLIGAAAVVKLVLYFRKGKPAA